MTKFIKWISEEIKWEILSNAAVLGIAIAVSVIINGIGLVFKYAEKGSVLAEIGSVIITITIIFWILFAFVYIIIRFLVNPIKFAKTRKKYLAEVYEVEKTFEGTSLVYYVSCKFTDENGVEKIKVTRVNRRIYNGLAPKKQRAFVMFSKDNYRKIDKISPPVYVPIFFGKKGKNESVKVLKGVYENEMEYNWIKSRKQV
jgi:hypothetical protein